MTLQVAPGPLQNPLQGASRTGIKGASPHDEFILVEIASLHQSLKIPLNVTSHIKKAGKVPLKLFMVLPVKVRKKPMQSTS
ncbi:hypothetical protein MBAV_004860 [Candidatus Magnetobacterium bavaricum]|uniref:Uncharacterized protein n=1 Tax=Candidatus Magnetobacterium bavaricum TaxID=29290 RepID=A0A0F3GM98_9BACT|nr:hypothetical protein MBAV_004860 [Candidatus Magnetobacterium bavaricum]